MSSGRDTQYAHTKLVSNFLNWLTRTTHIPPVLIVLLSVDTGKASSVNFQANIDILYLFHHTAEKERERKKKQVSI
jgi:hypothetical protein